MRKILLSFLLMLFIASFAMAAAPTLAVPTVDANYTNDRNYFTEPLNLAVVASGADLNADVNCWYQISTGGSDFIADWNGDTNTCSVSGLTFSGIDDFNFSFIVESASEDANATSDVMYYWKDVNSPTVAMTSVSGNPSAVTLACTDTATLTGSGSGCQLIYYWVGSGARKTASGASTTFNITEPGNQTVSYCAVDNLDNNRCSTTISTTTIYVGDITSTACTLLNLVFIAVAALVLIGVVAFGLMAGLDAKQIIPIIVMAIIVIIAIIIMGEVLSTSCAIV